MILGIKTDTDPTEIVFAGDDGEIVSRKIWSARRSLAKDLLAELKNLTDDFREISAVVVYEGPGSFTGLRIGITVANAISYAKNVPVFGASGEDWFERGVKIFAKNVDEKPTENFAKTEKATSENGVVFREKSELEKSAKIKIVMPKYGGEAHITAPKK